MGLKVQIDHKLRIALSELPPGTHEYIVEALSIPNIARQKAMEQNIWGWRDMPETISLWEHIGGSLVMPRGFYSDLISGLRALDIEFEIDDQREYEVLPAKGREITLHPHQFQPVAKILTLEQGIYKAPAGSGKTVAVLEAIRRSKSRSIVLVATKDILMQWQARAKEFLGDDYPVGQIGDDVFAPSEYLTVATVQTLHRRFSQLERNGFFDAFSFLCLDECHHATADTYNRLVNRFSCRYRVGVSATPDKTGDFALATNVLGPIIHTTLKKEVDSLVDPVVFRIPTDFRFAYRGAHGRRPSNYPKLLKHLIEDEDRNRLIAKSIMIEDGGHSLVVSKRLRHFDFISDELRNLEFKGPMWKLTGKETTEERQEIIEIASREDPCVIFSTLADEALDIPRLDRIFLVFPQRNPGLIEQQVGRICRSHPNKIGAAVFDFHDFHVGPLDNQWRVRRLQVYHPHGYKITTVRPDGIMKYEIR